MTVLSTSHVSINEVEMRQLNRLIGMALVDETVCNRLVVQRDRALFADFGLSPLVERWLTSMPAASLTEIARAIQGRLSD